MTPTRRDLLKTGAAAALCAAAPRFAQAAYAPVPSGWRAFELTTRIALPRAGRAAQAWVPVPALSDTLWSRPGPSRWVTNAASATLVEDPDQALSFVRAVWEAGEAPAELELISEVSVQNRAVDLAAPGAAAPLSEAERALALAPTALIPTDGIVRDTADGITQGASSDLDKAMRIYHWVVESSRRNPETRGCGLGDVATMLHSGDLSGKCADLNALFVGLARAAGLPARDLYGLRVAPSEFGYKSLGAGSSDVTKAQHCRAEVYLEGYGWVPADPADVRKVVLEEPPKTLTLEDAPVQDVRAALFGAAEGNWICYGTAHDVALPGASAGPAPFLMYPQAEIGGILQDELNPADFSYTITAREIS